MIIGQGYKIRSQRRFSPVDGLMIAAALTFVSPAFGQSTTPRAPAGTAQSATPNSLMPAAPQTPDTSATASSPLPAAATSGQTVHYDMAKTIAMALQASTDLANAERTVDIDRKQSDADAAHGRPSAGASGSATHFDGPTKISFGAGPPVTLIGDHTETLALSLSDQIDISGQIHAASTQAKLQSLADKFVADQIRNERILRARTTYYNLLRAQHQVAVAQASLETAVTQQTTAVNLNKSQVGQKIDVLRADTQVATAQQDLTRAQNNLGIAQQNFDNLVGQPITSGVAVDDVPGVTVGATVTSSSEVGAPSPNMTTYTVPQGDLSGIDMQKSIDAANNARPEVLAAEVGVRVQQTGIKLARAGLEPTLGINATGDYYPTTSFQTPRQRTAAITAVLNIPLYDGGATRDQVAEAKLRAENAEQTLASRRSDVALDVGQAYLNLTTAATQIDAANTALQQAIAARQLAQIRYTGQVGLYLEVTDAQAALVAAENNQVNAVYDYLVARAQFQNAIGAPQTQ